MNHVKIEDSKHTKKYLFIIVMLFVLLFLFNIWVLLDVYRTSEYTKPFYWFGFILLGIVGYYWYEFIDFLNKNRYYKIIIIIAGPFLYYLNKLEDIPILNSFLIAAPISPFMAILRVLILLFSKETINSHTSE